MDRSRPSVKYTHKNKIHCISILCIAYMQYMFGVRTYVRTYV